MERTAQRMVYMVLETQRTPAGGYIPCIVKEGEKGYYTTDWDWGTDIEVASRLATERNETMGIGRKEAYKIICRSMF